LGASLREPLPGLALAIRRQVLDLLALGLTTPATLAALAALPGVLGPGTTITAPTLAGIQLLRHQSTSTRI
jgi:hypothetical protein